LARFGVAVLAIGALVGGAVGVVATDRGTASLLLLTLGVVLLLVTWLGPRVRLESFGMLGAQLRVREVVAERARLSQAAVSEADAVERLRRQASTLQSLDRLLDLYAYIRANQPAGGERTRALDEVARRMQVEAGSTEFDPPEVATWFRDGTDALRVVALNVMIARPECQDLLAALTAIDEPRSLFEQYYGLELALAMAPGLGSVDRDLLEHAVRRAQRARRFRRDPSLPGKADQVLRALRHPSG
jgi:hypothetical protein